MTGNKQPAGELMFRDLSAELQKHLVDLSVNGYIYIGRTGIGLTGDYRKSTLQQGTLKVIEAEKRFIGEVKAGILQLVAIEGPKWVPFTRIEEEYYGRAPTRAVTRETERGVASGRSK